MEKFDCKIINGKKYLLFISIYILFGTIVTYLFVFFTHIYFYIWVGLIIFWVLPVLTPNLFLQRFIISAEFYFFDDYFEIKYFEKEIIYKFSNIRSFIIQSSYKDQSVFFKTLFYSNNKEKFTIVNQSNENDKLLQNEVIVCFKKYNFGKRYEDQIKLEPTFLLSNYGTFSMIILSILLSIALILQFIYYTKYISPTIIFATMLFISLFVQRNNDLKKRRQFYD